MRPRPRTPILPRLDDLIGEGLVIIDGVEVYRHTGRAGDRPEAKGDRT